MVAVPQVSEAPVESGELRTERNRVAARYFRACSSRAGSPEEFCRKQCRVSPFSFHATRKRAGSGASRPDAVNFSSGVCGERRESSSGEKRMTVAVDVTMVAAGLERRSTGAGGRALGICRGDGGGGKSFSGGWRPR